MWGEYGEWSACSATCDDGTRARKRPEDIPAENGGTACSGSATEKETCNNEICYECNSNLTFVFWFQTSLFVNP